MAKKLYEEANIQAIANSLRNKCGTTCGYKTCDMAAAIDSITTGGGGTAAEKVVIDISKSSSGTGGHYYCWDTDMVRSLSPNNPNLVYELDAISVVPTIDKPGLIFSGTYCNVNTYVGQVQLAETIQNLIDSNNKIIANCDMFWRGNSSTSVEIPSWVTKLAPITAYCLFDTGITSSYAYNYEYGLTAIPVMDFTYLGDYNYFSRTGLGSSTSLSMADMFSGNSRITTIPSSMLKQMKFKNYTETQKSNISATAMPYSETFRGCAKLATIREMAVNPFSPSYNSFQYTFEYCSALASFTFEMNGSSPVVADWQSQTIDLSYATTRSTAYNHASMVETINSLPDVSGNATGGNTIKFSTSYGGSELTAAEIAVATARGWTVTLV